MKNLNKHLWTIGAMVIASMGSGAFASTLTEIPPLGADTDSEGRAITPDGKYVVGLSGTNTGFFFNVANGYLVQPISSDGAASQIATGVGYRTYEGQQEVVLSGKSIGWYANWMTTDGGTNWGLKRRDLGWGTKPTVPAANGLAGTSSNYFFSGWVDQNASDWQVYIGQFTNAWPMNPTNPPGTSLTYSRKGVPAGTEVTLNGVSGNGRGVGRRGTANYVLDWNGAGSTPPFYMSTPVQWYFYGLVPGYLDGEAFAVNADGTIIFGRSPVMDRVGTWGYKAEFSPGVPPGGSYVTPLNINELPYFPDTTGSSSLVVPYGCSPDGRYAVGMNYRSTEKAVLWDTGDANPANWTITDLTDLAASNNILGNFIRLTRAYSVGVNATGNPVITGRGVWSPDGGTTLYTRGFVMEVGTTAVPQPVITSITGAGTASVTVNYSNTVPGSSYTLQYNTNLNTANWYDAATAPAGGSTASQTDTTAIPGEPQRYYRVRTP